MRLLFTKSKWEAPQLTLDTFLDRVVADGFDGSELHLIGQSEPAARIRHAHAERGLLCIAQVTSAGNTPDEHLADLLRQLDTAAEVGAVRVNAHAGCDVFPFNENLRILSSAINLGRKLRLPLCFETHRGRPTFSGPGTRQLLEALPDLRLTADFSHWMCVHESTLEDQGDTLALAQSRSDHLHARIGFPQGPQVAQPFAPEWAGLRERYLALWRPILAQRRAEGRDWFAITPEAGPAGYMPVLPFTRQPLADAWEVNVAMRDWLRPLLGDGLL
jgi:sugar phosphate isomerase/epimerase